MAAAPLCSAPTSLASCGSTALRKRSRPFPPAPQPLPRCGAAPAAAPELRETESSLHHEAASKRTRQGPTSCAAATESSAAAATEPSQKPTMCNAMPYGAPRACSDAAQRMECTAPGVGPTLRRDWPGTAAEALVAMSLASVPNEAVPGSGAHVGVEPTSRPNAAGTGDDAHLGVGPTSFPSPPATASTRAEEERRRDILDVLPAELVLGVMAKLPPQAIASRVALVSSRWRRLASSQELWKSLCSAENLTLSDARQCIGGWRGLYGRVFGSNLIHSPSFEPMDHHSLRYTPDGFTDNGRFASSFKPSLDGVISLHGAEQQYQGYSAWSTDKLGVRGLPGKLGRGTLLRSSVSGPLQTPADVTAGVTADVTVVAGDVEVPGMGVKVECASPCARCDSGCEAPAKGSDGGAAGNGKQAHGGAKAQLQASKGEILSDRSDEDATFLCPSQAATPLAPAPPPGNAQEVPQVKETAIHRCTAGAPSPALPPPGSAAITASDYSWGCLRQRLSLRSFSGSFLDQSPAVHLSLWCAGLAAEGGEDAGELRIQMEMLGGNKAPLYHWSSEVLSISCNKWRHVSHLISGLPPGVRYMTVKLAARRVHLAKVQGTFVPSK